MIFSAKFFHLEPLIITKIMLKTVRTTMAIYLKKFVTDMNLFFLIQIQLLTDTADVLGKLRKSDFTNFFSKKIKHGEHESHVDGQKYWVSVREIHFRLNNSIFMQNNSQSRQFSFCANSNNRVENFHSKVQSFGIILKVDFFWHVHLNVDNRSKCKVNESSFTTENIS